MSSTIGNNIERTTERKFRYKAMHSQLLASGKLHSMKNCKYANAVSENLVRKAIAQYQFDVAARCKIASFPSLSHSFIFLSIFFFFRKRETKSEEKTFIVQLYRVPGRLTILYSVILHRDTHTQPPLERKKIIDWILLMGNCCSKHTILIFIFHEKWERK